MRMRVAHDLETAEGTDRRAEYHVARPVLVVVHARETNQSCAAVHDRRDERERLGIEPTRLTGHRRRHGECGRGMPRGKRLSFGRPETAPELEVAWIRIRRRVRTRAAERPLE